MWAGQGLSLSARDKPENTTGPAPENTQEVKIHHVETFGIDFERCDEKCFTWSNKRFLPAGWPRFGSIRFRFAPVPIRKLFGSIRFAGITKFKEKKKQKTNMKTYENIENIVKIHRK